MGGAEHPGSVKKHLEKEIEEQFQFYHHQDGNKDIYETFKTQSVGLFDFFQSCKDRFEGDTEPHKMEPMLEATAEANNISAIAATKEFYVIHMENSCGEGKPFVGADALQNFHELVKHKAINDFYQNLVMGDAKSADKYEKQLEMELEQLFELYRARNDNKDGFKIFKKPGTIFVLMCVAGSFLLGRLLHNCK